MCNGIHEALLTILQKSPEGALTATEAQEFLENLSKEKRYLRDLWG